jgi:hypothetical protein
MEQLYMVHKVGKKYATNPRDQWEPPHENENTGYGNGCDKKYSYGGKSLPLPPAPSYNDEH